MQEVCTRVYVSPSAPSNISTASVPTIQSLLHLELTFLQSEVGIWGHSLAWGYSVFPEPFVEDALISLFVIFVEN